VYSLYHETFRDFVSQRLGSLKDAHGSLSDFFYNWRELEGYDLGYATSYLPHHLAMSGKWEQLEAVLEDEEFLQATGPSGFIRGFRFEAPEWQGAYEAWLGHVYRTRELRDARVVAALTYFRSFWWWGEYVQSTFADRLVAACSKAEARLGDPRFSEALERFHASFPTRYQWQDRLEEHDRWLLAEEALSAIESLTGCDRAESLDVQQGPLRGFLNAYLGDCRASCGDGACLDHYRVARERFADSEEDAWGVPYIWTYEADFCTQQGRLEDAVAACLAALDLADDADEEVRADSYRAWGDALWSGGDRTRAWAAYRLATYHAFLCHAIPHPADAYTIAYYHEVRERVMGRLDEEASFGEDRALRAAEEFRTFWSSYGSDGMAVHTPPDADQLRNGLAAGALGSTAAELLPHLPFEGDEEYAAMVLRVAARMAGRIAEEKSTLRCG